MNYSRKQEAVTSYTDTQNTDCVYAALKLIELLYKDGKIKAHVWRNILREYGGVVDPAQFAECA